MSVLPFFFFFFLPLCKTCRGSPDYSNSVSHFLVHNLKTVLNTVVLDYETVPSYVASDLSAQDEMYNVKPVAFKSCLVRHV